MECIKCGGKTKVKESRPFAGTRYRKRLCLKCGKIFWTSEEPASGSEVKEMMAANKMKQRDKKRM